MHYSSELEDRQMNTISHDTARVIAHLLAPAGEIPNHPRWPLLVYPGAVKVTGPDPAMAFETLFAATIGPPPGATASIRSTTSTATRTKRSASTAVK